MAEGPLPLSAPPNALLLSSSCTPLQVEGHGSLEVLERRSQAGRGTHAMNETQSHCLSRRVPRHVLAASVQGLEVKRLLCPGIEVTLGHTPEYLGQRVQIGWRTSPHSTFSNAPRYLIREVGAKKVQRVVLFRNC